MKKPVLVLALLLSATIPALAQLSPIQSRIVDLNGVGVPDVTITEMARCNSSAPPPTGSATKTYVTDANGNFTWPQLNPPGGGSSCASSLVYTFQLNKEGYAFTRTSFYFMPPSPNILPGLADDRIPLIHATTLPTWKLVSAASYRPPTPPPVGPPIPSVGFPSPIPYGITSEMIIAGFGSDLTTSTEVAQGMLPTTLAGRKIIVKDSAGVEKAAKFFFASPLQINFLVPEGLADGPALFRLLDESDNLIKVGLTEIKKVSHGIFTANADGAGVPAGAVVRVKPGDVQIFEPIAQFDEAAQRYVPLSIDLGPDDEFLVLVLFGTGWRNVRPESASEVAAVGDGFTTTCPIEYIGKQPTLDGLDQCNVRLPRALIGKGDVELRFSINGFTANTVRLKFK